MQDQYGHFADIYDPLMRDVDYETWAQYISAFMPEGKLYIADCACGTGKLAIKLAGRGHIVTGVDISESMLAVAGEKSRKCGKQILFVRQDIRALELHRPVDVVTCACDGVNYLTSTGDMKRFFNAAFAHLKPGGLLLFDISSRYKLFNIIGNNTFAQDDGVRAYIWHNDCDEQSCLISMRLSFFVKEGDSYKRFTEHHLQRAHSQSEVEAALDAVGFEDCHAYEAFTKQQPQTQTQRIQFVARRPL
ncbi:MAG: methyltransferase domain-containing protein [Clostridia bacterium]